MRLIRLILLLTFPRADLGFDKHLALLPRLMVTDTLFHLCILGQSTPVNLRLILTIVFNLFVDRPVRHLTIWLLVVTLLVFQRGKPDNGSLYKIICHSL